MPASFVTTMHSGEGEKATKACQGKNNLSMCEMKFAVVLGYWDSKATCTSTRNRKPGGEGFLRYVVGDTVAVWLRGEVE